MCAKGTLPIGCVPVAEIKTAMATKKTTPGYWLEVFKVRGLREGGGGPRGGVQGKGSKRRGRGSKGRCSREGV